MTELICQHECTEAACWYVRDECFDITLALCEEHKNQALEKHGKIAGKVGDAKMERQYKEARQFEEWLADTEARIPGMLKWIIETYPRIFAKALKEVLREQSLETCFKKVTKCMEEEGWMKGIDAFEGEYWTRPLSKSALVIKREAFVETTPAQVCEA